jgi:hypothetical protein
VRDVQPSVVAGIQRTIMELAAACGLTAAGRDAPPPGQRS